MAVEQKVLKIYPTFDKCGGAHYQLYSTPKGSEVIQQCIIYPERVIPVIFVPGVMGSNLKSNTVPDEMSIWRLDSPVKLVTSWFKLGAACRKVKLNPDTTTVDDGGRVDEEDAPFLLQNRRERGWGSVAYASYAPFLSWLQNSLNDFDTYPLGERHGLLERSLKTETGDVSLVTEEVDLTYRYLFPVFAVGYNWLQSNADSAEYLGNEIDKIIRFYQGKGRQCEKVVLITHSMGGLVARHYTQNLGGEKNVLGVVHGVMPALGAPATYRRMKAGTEYPEGSIMGWITSQVLGGDAPAMTAVLAQAPGPLQLLPGREYGTRWLKILDEREVDFYPKEDPYQEIYLQRDKWWGLCEEQFIDPGKHLTPQEREKNWSLFSALIKDKVMTFIESLSGKYHPNTYIFYGADAAFAAYGEICWQSRTPNIEQWLNRNRPRHASRARALDKTERHNIRTVASPLSGTGWATGIYQRYHLLPPREAGDGTVPERSGRVVGHHLQARFRLSTLHEAAYHAPPAQQFTLRALIKIIQQVKGTSLAEDRA